MRKISEFTVVGRNDEIDEWYGLYDFTLTSDDIQALFFGKKLYASLGDEYALTLVWEPKTTEESEIKNDEMG